MVEGLAESSTKEYELTTTGEVVLAIIGTRMETTLGVAVPQATLTGDGTAGPDRTGATPQAFSSVEAARDAGLPSTAQAVTTGRPHGVRGQVAGPEVIAG